MNRETVDRPAGRSMLVRYAPTAPQRPVELGIHDKTRLAMDTLLRTHAWEWLYLLAVIVIALIAGLVPAMKAYRTPVATNLSAA